MSVESMAKALKVQGLTQTEKLILIGIANHDGDGGAWPGKVTLAEYACVTARTVQRTIRSLEEKGLIETELNAGGNLHFRNDRRPNRYHLHLDQRGDTGVAPSNVNGETPDATTGRHQTPPRGDIAVSPEPSLEPSLEPSTPLKAPQGAEVVPDWIDMVFGRWWEMYPRKVGKPAAFKAFKRHVKKPGDDDQVMTGTHRWISVWQASDTATQFIPHPTTFLNQERFNDFPAVDNPKSDPMSILQRIADRDQ